MLSIGKLNFSPNLEHTPKALSSKNNLSFCMTFGLILHKLAKLLLTN